MNAIALFAVMLFSSPILAADATPAVPPSLPSPPAVSYDVWGFRWDGRQFVKQSTHSFTTTDLKQAADYVQQVDQFAGWTATTNLPDACYVHPAPALAAAQPPPAPGRAEFSVWAFRLSGDKWVKDDAHSWTTSDPVSGLEYAKKVHAVAGWTATTNCPEPIPAAQRYAQVGPWRGATNRGGYGVTVRTERDGGQTIYLPYMTVRLPAGMVRNLHAAGQGSTETVDNSFYSNYDNSAALNDEANLRNMLQTQDMINTQQQNNNIQDMINTQNAINTQNMVDAQNAVNAQNAANAMNP
jgi:hypothetical protein